MNAASIQHISQRIEHSPRALMSAAARARAILSPRAIDKLWLDAQPDTAITRGRQA